jgi:hypothetical protein
MPPAFRPSLASTEQTREHFNTYGAMQQSAIQVNTVALVIQLLGETTWIHSCSSRVLLSTSSRATSGFLSHEKKTHSRFPALTVSQRRPTKVCKLTARKLHVPQRATMTLDHHATPQQRRQHRPSPGVMQSFIVMIIHSKWKGLN